MRMDIPPAAIRRIAARRAAHYNASGKAGVVSSPADTHRLDRASP